ncbi:hypothetical protein G6F68_021833 [Rhizopus microsporus]|nr:hypothetical protein G6F68_021833 [Rhizopus microsporus]
MATSQSANTPPPWPPMARMAILIGLPCCSATGFMKLSSLQGVLGQARRAAALQEPDDGPAHPGQEAVAARRVGPAVGAVD